jgi:hypothetical protein
MLAGEAGAQGGPVACGQEDCLRPEETERESGLRVSYWREASTHQAVQPWKRVRGDSDFRLVLAKRLGYLSYTRT